MEFLLGTFVGGIAIGLCFGLIDLQYKKLLLSKSKNHEAECLFGNFVIIVPEDDYNKMLFDSIHLQNIKMGKATE